MEGKVTICARVSDAELSNRELAERIKAEHPGVEPVLAWNHFVKARCLRPGIDLRDFVRLYESCVPDQHVRTREQVFTPTHKDSITGLSVMAVQEGPLWRLAFEDGHIGTEPGVALPARFIPIREGPKSIARRLDTMASTYSEILLVGRLTHKPELSATPNGTQVAHFTVAVDRPAEGQKVTDFFRTTAWGKTAEAVAEHLDKGSLCLVRGHPEIQRWEKDGQKHETFQVQAAQVKFLDRQRTSEAAAER
jgi:single-strand DNA-binding protein